MRLAILIWGIPDSGKTSTFKAIVQHYSGKKVPSRMRRGWQRFYLNPKFTHLNLDAYLLPASPTESNEDISTMLKGKTPDVLFLAEQINGSQVTETLRFLKPNYYILEYTLTNQNGNGIWDRFDSLNKQAKLKARADEIIEDVRAFISTNGII